MSLQTLMRAATLYAPLLAAVAVITGAAIANAVNPAIGEWVRLGLVWLWTNSRTPYTLLVELTGIYLAPHILVLGCIATLEGARRRFLFTISERHVSQAMSRDYLIGMQEYHYLPYAEAASKYAERSDTFKIMRRATWGLLLVIVSVVVWDYMMLWASLGPMTDLMLWYLRVVMLVFAMLLPGTNMVELPHAIFLRVKERVSETLDATRPFTGVR